MFVSVDRVGRCESVFVGVSVLIRFAFDGRMRYAPTVFCIKLKLKDLALVFHFSQTTMLAPNQSFGII